MQCEGMFKYKGLTHIAAGSFKNDKGETIQYNESYKLKVDEFTPQGIYERTFKVASDSALVPEFMKLNVYDDVHILFDVIIYSSSCRVVPVGIKKDKNN